MFDVPVGTKAEARKLAPHRQYATHSGTRRPHRVSASAVSARVGIATTHIVLKFTNLSPDNNYTIYIQMFIITY